MRSSSVEQGQHKLVIDSHDILFKPVGMKYLICEMREKSVLKDKTIRFKTLENQNVLDVIAKVIGKAKFEVNYIISNKNVSYVSMNRSVDATQLLILLKNQNYEVDWSNVYHEYEYFKVDCNLMAQTKKHVQNKNLNSHRFKPYGKFDHNVNHKSQTDQNIKSLESTLAQTNDKLNNLMNELASKQTNVEHDTQLNCNLRHQQNSNRVVATFDPCLHSYPPNLMTNNIMPSIPPYVINQSAYRMPSLNHFVNNNVHSNNMNPYYPYYQFYPFM
jgi:hypothetical protein